MARLPVDRETVRSGPRISVQAQVQQSCDSGNRRSRSSPPLLQHHCSC
jgi:hypothetical protein